MESESQKKNLGFFNRADEALTSYLYHDGDGPETLFQKKLWWLFNIGGLPFLIALSLMISKTTGPYIDIINIINVFFALSMIVPLVIFHFHRRHIERFILFMQVSILVLATTKVYLMGGLLEAGTPIFIALTSPLYALASGNRKRAIVLYVIFLAAMIATAELQPGTIHDYYLFYSYLGFSLGITIAFIGLFYYTGQLMRLKQMEKNRMQELDKLKSNFFTHITHELRTPLTVILGMTDQILENPDQNPEKGLSMIRRNGKKLLDMTNKLLDLSRMEARMMPVNWVQQDLVAYLKYLVESFHSLAEYKQVELAYDISEKNLLMDIDPDKMADIVSNLVSNAIKFTQSGGKVLVKMTAHEGAGEKFVRLEVKDNGRGIEKEYLPKIFERYFQAQRHQNEYTEGSGLGLAVTREMVQLLNGRITVSSELKKGSVFTVTLPITNKANLETVPGLQSHAITEKDLSDAPFVRSKTREDAEFTRRRNGKLKVLVVEDSKDVANYLSSLLSGDYQIENARNGTEGVEMALRTVPDLIISDVMMPVMNGFALCKELKSDIRTSHIPIILLTARNESAARMEGLKAGADAYLGKPFNKEELFIRVDKLIELRQRLRESYGQIAQNPEMMPSHETISGEGLDRPMNLEYAFMKKVAEILEEHLSDEEFGIHELCETLGMSRSQLYRKFSALTDISVNQFIQNLRLNKARQLLHSSDLNVSEVAYDTGFKNPSHFSRVYSKRFGVAPSKERQASLT